MVCTFCPNVSRPLLMHLQNSFQLRERRALLNVALPSKSTVYCLLSLRESLRSFHCRQRTLQNGLNVCLLRRRNGTHHPA